MKEKDHVMDYTHEAANGNEEFVKELAALARLITYARQSARELQIAFPTYCLDLALGAVLEEMEGHGVEAQPMTRPSDHKLFHEVH
jgi:hypothetical protein